MQKQKNSTVLANDENKSLKERELYKNYPSDGFMTGCLLFNSILEAYDVYESLINYERNQFDPSGCLLS
eukprot:7183312-Ditylum_brightwellii.AAC.1